MEKQEIPNLNERVDIFDSAMTPKHEGLPAQLRYKFEQATTKRFVYVTIRYLDGLLVGDLVFLSVPGYLENAQVEAIMPVDGRRDFLVLVC